MLSGPIVSFKRLRSNAGPFFMENLHAVAAFAVCGVDIAQYECYLRDT
jgi:hypothetical protein